jgi:endo-1,4-beta-xylanase
MKKQLLLLFIAFAGRAAAQDAYHNSLNGLLQNTYSLPNPQQWILPNTEAATLANSIDYGGTTTNITPTGQSFSVGRRRELAASANPWDAGHLYTNTSAIAAGDRCLLIIWLRSPGPNGKANLFVENATTYEKEVYTPVNVGNEWKMYATPFEAKINYAVGALSLGLHLAFGNQTIELGGAACLNYKNTVFFTQLPVLLNNDDYAGQEPDAPWRAQAEADIEQLRKADLTVQVRGPGGQPISGAEVRVEMVRHEFKFGTAVVSNKFNGGSEFNATYEQKLLNLDGKGRGFNELVFENDLKWPAWEQQWFSSKPAIADDVK